MNRCGRDRRLYRATWRGPRVQVWVVADDTRKLEHVVRHSPDGFGAGYGGSGPSDLARCLLLEHLAIVDDAKKLEHPTRTDPLVRTITLSDGALEAYERVERYYQAFKWDVVANLPRFEGWDLEGERVDDWLSRHR